MTDLEQYVDMLDRADIDYREICSAGCTRIDVERGYSVFYTSHEFDKDGKLIDAGAYE